MLHVTTRLTQVSLDATILFSQVILRWVRSRQSLEKLLLQDLVGYLVILAGKEQKQIYEWPTLSFAA